MRVGLLALILAAPVAHAQHDHHAHTEAPATEARTDLPAALSADEAAGLLAGRGMGMATAAEANRYPGPLHVLEHADALELSAEQRVTAERLRDEMRASAQALGARLVEVERHLDALFASGTATTEAIDRMTAHAARLRGEIRASHLRTHVAMRAAMTTEQIATYNGLRGRDG